MFLKDINITVILGSGLIMAKTVKSFQVILFSFFFQGHLVTGIFKCLV